MTTLVAEVLMGELCRADVTGFISFPISDNGETLAIVVVQRPDGKSPIERYHEVVKERDALIVELAAARATA